MNPAGPSTIAAAKFPVAQKPQYGGEAQVFLSRLPMVEIGTFEVLGLNSGTFTADAINDAILADRPCHLVAMVENELDGDGANVVLTVNGTDNTDSVIAATATFKPVDWHKDQTRYWGISKGTAVEQASDKLFKTVTSVTASVAALAVGSKITLFAVPVQSSFTLVGCTEQADFSTKSNPAKEIPCGMDGSAFSKPGRSEPGKVSINSKASDFGDGLAKYDGADVTVMIKVVKQKTVETGRLYFAGYHLKVRGTNPDGDGYSMYEGDGIYEDMVHIPAYGA